MVVEWRGGGLVLVVEEWRGGDRMGGGGGCRAGGGRMEGVVIECGGWGLQGSWW